ncbi:MAG: PIN domain-containing protein [Methylocystis sp.]
MRIALARPRAGPCRASPWRSEKRGAREDHARLDDFLSAVPEIAAVDADDARAAGDIRAYLEGHGKPIGPYDVLIAAQARRRGAVLVTANRREFDRVPGLMVTDWNDR